LKGLLDIKKYCPNIFAMHPGPMLCILARLEALKGLLDIKKYCPNIFARCVVVMYTQRPQLSRKR